MVTWGKGAKTKGRKADNNSHYKMRTSSWGGSWTTLAEHLAWRGIQIKILLRMNVEPVPARSCGDPCPEENQAAVCGNDGTTYLSQCHLEEAACQNPCLTLQHEGPCSECCGRTTKYSRADDDIIGHCSVIQCRPEVLNANLPSWICCLEQIWTECIRVPLNGRKSFWN